MTTFREETHRSVNGADKLSIAEIIDALTVGEIPLRLSAYDGSVTGPTDAEYGLHLKTPRGTTYMATAPGDLGMARAYVSGDLEAIGIHPGDPYELLKILEQLHFRRPTPKVAAKIVRSLGWERLRPIDPPPQEAPSRLRRVTAGLRHSKRRDADVIHYHYDVSNAFYEHVLGPSMTYTCAAYDRSDATLEQAQENKYRLVFDKLRLHAGDRLLDVGCGWGGMVRYAARHGVKVIGATLSAEQAAWARSKIAEEELQDLADVRHCDYRDIPEAGFDAVSSIGLTEHIGIHNYPGYFRFINGKLRDGGLLLNHCITRKDNSESAKAGSFIDRYVFPDGELVGPGRIIAEIHDTGFEVRHEENLREHYALTLAEWCHNLVKNWDACVAEVGEETAKIWGLYMAGSRRGFERNAVQLHQVLAAKLDVDGNAHLPLRPWWTP